MLALPPLVESVIAPFSIAFTRPTFQRFVLVLIAAILTPGKRTLTHALATVEPLLQGHVSSYHRLFSCRRWSLWPLAHILARMVLTLVPQGEPVIVAMDDHATEHRGPKVYGKGCHRDAVRSTRKHPAWLWGHSWVVLAVCVKLPGLNRPWALPLLSALYRPPKVSQREGRRHKTPVQLSRSLMAALMHWFPDRHFIFLGDGHYARHELAHFCHRHRDRATLISRLPKDAKLYEAPPPRRPGQVGRPRVRGAKLPRPCEVVAQSRPVKAQVNWYGGEQREVELVSGTGHWYKAGLGLTPLRWVYVQDPQGEHRPEYFFSTDVDMEPAQIVSLYTGRWQIEVTFEEARAHLGLPTPRVRVQASVLRVTPCLLGLFSVVSLLAAHLSEGEGIRARQVPGYGKVQPTFEDALAAVRRLLWEQVIFSRAQMGREEQKPPPSMLHTLLTCLSYAA